MTHEERVSILAVLVAVAIILIQTVRLERQIDRSEALEKERDTLMRVLVKTGPKGLKMLQKEMGTDIH